MPGIRNREIILEVAFSVLICSSLEQGSECLLNLGNMALYEGEENTIMSLRADPINKSLTIKPTSDELGTFTISDYDGDRDPSLAGLFYPNQSGLGILNDTTIDFGNPISTSGLYIAECPNNIRTGVKLLVVLHCGATITGRISTIQTANGIEPMSTIQPYTTTGPVSTAQPCTTIGETPASQRLTTNGSISTIIDLHVLSKTSGWKTTSESATVTTWTGGWNSSGSSAKKRTSAAPIARPNNIYANNSITTGDTIFARYQSFVDILRVRSDSFTIRTVGNRSKTTTSSISTSEEWQNIFDVSPDAKVLQHIKLHGRRVESLFCSSPIIESSDELLEFDPSTDELIDIKGRNLSQECLLRDYLVRIGNQVCTNYKLQDNQLSCRPPKVEPSPAVNDTIYCGQHLRISIIVGHNQYQYACLSYIYRSRIIIFIVGLTVGLVGFALLLAIPIVCIVRRRRKKIALSKICVHQNNRGQEVKNRVPKKAVQPKSQGDYGDMEHCYA